jgi:cell division protein FtsB
MSTSENSNGNKTYNVHLSQQKIKDLNKDFIIKKLQKELATLSKEAIKLRTENAELRSRVSLINSYEQNYKIAKETINEIRDQTNKIICKKDDEQRKLKLQIEQMELEKAIEELKNNRNMTLYNQKMSVVHHIEMENNVYRDEVKELKEKNEKLNLATKEKLESLDIINQLKFSQFKRKMIDSLKEAKNNVSKLNLEYMDLNGKITVLQNHQLLSEIEFQKEQIDNLDKENSILKKKIFDLEKDLAIHKKVEIKLALKAKNNRNNDNEINLKTENLSERKSKNEDIILNNSNGVTLLPINDNNNFKLINGKNIINKEKINNMLNNNENVNKNNKVVSKSSTSYNNKFRYDSNYNIISNSQSERNGSEINFKYIKYNNLIKNKNNEIERLNIINDNLKNKLEQYIGKNKKLFLFLQESLNIFFIECQETLKNKNIHVDIENIKNFNFESLKNEEKYGILLLLMKFLFPLVVINYTSNSINNIQENLFKTNVNIVKRFLPYNSAEKYLKDTHLKEAFVGKKIKTNLFTETNSFQNKGNKNFIPFLRKTDSLNDSKMKNKKYKSLIK